MLRKVLTSYTSCALKMTGSSDLPAHASFWTQVYMTYLYNGCHASICPPPRTMNWCPLDHFRRHFDWPISLRHSLLVGLRIAVSCSRLGCCAISWAVPTWKEETGLARKVWEHIAHLFKAPLTLLSVKYITQLQKLHHAYPTWGSLADGSIDFACLCYVPWHWCTQ